MAPRAGAALLIGIGDYLHAERVQPLRYAARDARALARSLVNRELCGFPTERVAVLADRRARRDSIVQRLSHWLPEQARGAELALIYFAGHGTVRPVGPREEGYLLPYDTDPDNVAGRGVAMSDLAAWIDAIDARAVVVCLDCCHAGKVLTPRGEAEPEETRNLELRPAVLQRITGKGRFLIASCDEGQKSFESAELRHGLFTYHLLRGIRGAADRDGDGRVGIAELFNYVAGAVARDAREKFGCEQKPWTSATWADETYISCPAARPAKTMVAPPRELTLAEIEEKAATATPDELADLLGVLRKRRDPAAVPVLFRCLAHVSEIVREQARKALHVLGWDVVSAAVMALADGGDSTRLAAVLDGLAAFEAHPRVVGLLDWLTTLLHGDLRNRAIMLLERKRLGLELEEMARLFREIRSPYRIEKVLGQGLFAAAYLARVTDADLPVVVRVLRPELAQQAHLRAQFLDLGQRALHLVHQNLVLTREARAFADRNIYYTVRDYVEGVTLQRVLEGGKRFEPLQIVRLLRQVLAGLTPLERRGLWHGAVKPSNIFLGEEDRVVLGDPSLPPEGIVVARERLAYDYRYAAPQLSS
jgi:hypothetical protein